MPWASMIGSGIEATGSTVGGFLGAAANKKALKAQSAAMDKVIAAINDQGAEYKTMFQPYTAAGGVGLDRYTALAGLDGPQDQQAEIAALEASPIFQALLQQGETGILQNASATGGLRGGNVQGALAQFRPQMLDALINQQLGRYGNIMGTGFDAVSNLSQLRGANTNAMVNALTGQGNVQAQQQLAKYQGWINAADAAAGFGKSVAYNYGMGGMNPLGGGGQQGNPGGTVQIGNKAVSSYFGR